MFLLDCLCIGKVGVMVRWHLIEFSCIMQLFVCGDFAFCGDSVQVLFLTTCRGFLIFFFKFALVLHDFIFR